MKLTKSTLKQIIKEELENIKSEGFLDKVLNRGESPEKYRNKIEGYKKIIDDSVEYAGPELQRKIETSVMMAVEEVLLNIKDEQLRSSVQELVMNILGEEYVLRRVDEYGSYTRDQPGDLTNRLSSYRYEVGTQGFDDLKAAEREYHSLGGREGIYDKERDEWIVRSRY
jgi:hypothetical protein